MAAQFKSNVRIREEKGFGSVSMKRLIFCGVGAVLIFMVVRFTPLASIALPVLVVVFGLLLALTGERGGLALWKRLLSGLRGLILLAALRHPAGPALHLARLLRLDPSAARLHPQRVFDAGASETVDVDLSEWVMYADLAEAEAAPGLRFLEDVEVPDDGAI